MKAMNESIQNESLDSLKNERRRVTVITVNGFQMKSLIACHDQCTILMEANGRRQLVYKHAVSTIIRED